MSDIENVWSSWKNLFFKAVDRNIPSKLISAKRNVPWFNSALKKLIRKKQRLWKTAKSSGSHVKWANYKKFSNKVKEQLRKAYYEYVKNLTNSRGENPKKFWTFVKARTGTSSIPNVIEFNGLKGYSPSSIAELFNSFFQSVFNKNDGLSAVPNYPLRTNHVISDLICAKDEILSLLLNLEVTKSSGPDGISSRILKECARELAPSLTYLFNISLSTGELPGDWKKANVVPIHKSGERILADTAATVITPLVLSVG